MRRLSVAALAASCFLCAALPAAAQKGAMWVDPAGRMMSMHFAGGNGSVPVAADRPAADMVRLFKSICLEGAGDEARIGAAATAAGLTADPQTMGGSKKAAPLTLNLWTGNGLVLSQTTGFFAAPNAQCNAVFYVSSLPDKQAVIDALAAALGSSPSNVADAIDKKGKPKKYYTPEWKLEGAGGPQIVTAFVEGGSRYMPGSRVQMSVRAAKKAGK